MVDSDSDETGVFDRSEDSGRREAAEADGRPRRRMKEMGRGWIVVGRRKAGEDSGGLQRGCVALRSVALRRAALLLLLLMRRRRCVRLC